MSEKARKIRKHLPGDIFVHSYRYGFNEDFQPGEQVCGFLRVLNTLTEQLKRTSSGGNVRTGGETKLAVR